MKSAVKFALLSLLFSSGICAAAEAAEENCLPTIGINTDIDGEKPEIARVNTQYLDAVIKAGAVPVLLPPMPEGQLRSILPKLDGILMIGGDDYPPSLYKQEKHPSVSTMKSKRSQFDMLLASEALKQKGMPFLGICAGCQALNIASGGSLMQDIPSGKPESKIKHSSPEGWKKGFSKHPVQLEKNSKLAGIFGETSLEVVSSHHQCVDKTGENLKLAARAEDGVCEAIEKSGDDFVVGVQWHPERDYESNQKLFGEFVKSACKYHDSKAAK